MRTFPSPLPILIKFISKILACKEDLLYVQVLLKFYLCVEINSSFVEMPLIKHPAVFLEENSRQFKKNTSQTRKK